MGMESVPVYAAHTAGTDDVRAAAVVNTLKAGRLALIQLAMVSDPICVDAVRIEDAIRGVEMIKTS